MPERACRLAGVPGEVRFGIEGSAGGLIAAWELAPV